MSWDLAASLQSLREHKKPGPAKPYQCAHYVNRALSDGGIHLRPVKPRNSEGPSACDYGDSLEDVGFEVVYDNTEDDVACRSYHPLSGDIVIFMPIAAETRNGLAIHLHKHGHIQMYDGQSRAWIS